MKWFFLYLLVVNLFGYFLIITDKKRARRGEWRIPENQIWMTSIIGGSLGVYFSMKKIRHKTQHKKFMFGIPLIIILQIIIFSWFVL